MSQGRRTKPSQLFTVRVWRENLGNGQTEWRGRAQHVLSVNTCSFRDWSKLIDFLTATQSDKGEQEAFDARG